MADRTVAVKVSVDAEQALGKFRQLGVTAKDSASKAEQAFAKQKISVQELGRVAAATSVVFSAAFVAMVKASADFEQRMSQVQALSKATSSQMSQLRDAAFTAGKAFGLSATQVADAQIELTKAGVSVKDIIGGALPGALALAAAGQIDVAKATEIASNAMTEFKLRGADVPHIADLLAAGADKSVASVGSLGDALNQSGLVAAQFGLSVEDTVGTLTAFSKAGLNGSDAGTSFKTMLTQLASPSKQAQAYLDKYNITLYDSQGSFIGITGLADQLKSKLGGLSQAQRNAALSTIFGNDAIRASSVLYDLGGKKLQGFIDANNEAGFAALQASKKLDNLNGDVQKLGAAFQNDLIKSGSAGNDALRGFTKGATGLLDVFGDLPKPIQAVGLGVTGVGAAVTAAGAAFLLLSPKILAAKAALKELNVTGKSAALTFGKGAVLTVGLSALAGGLSNLGATGDVNAQQLEQAAVRIKGSYKDIDKAFPKSSVFDFGGKGVGGGAKASLDYLTTAGGKANILAANFLDGATAALTFGAAGTHLGDVFKSNEETWAATGTALAGLAKTDYAGAARSFNSLVRELGGGVDTAKQLISPDVMPAYREELVALAKSAGVAATDSNLLDIAQRKGAAGAKVLAVQQQLAAAAAAKHQGALNVLAGTADKSTTSITDLKAAIEGLDGGQLDARAAARGFQAAIDDATAAVKTNGRTLDIHTAKGRDNQDKLDALAQSTKQWAASTLAATNDQAAATKIVQDGRAEYVKAATAMGLSAKAADKLATSIFKIPAPPHLEITLSNTAALQRIKETIAQLKKLNGAVANVYINAVNTSKIPTSVSGALIASGRAGGGSIEGPGPKGKDSVLIYAAPGEHVLTAKEVDKMGGQASVYKFRAALNAYANGGAIGDSAAAASKAAADAARYASQLRAAKADAARAGKAYDAIDGTKKNAAAKKAAKARQDAADKKVDDLQKQLDDARQKRTDATTAAAALRNDREDFVSGQRRATADNPIDPLSYIDDLRSMSRDSNFSAARQKTYAAAANAYEKSLVDLTTKQKTAADTLDQFTQAADSMRSSITSAITGQYGLSGIGSSTAATGSFMRNGMSFTSYGSGFSADAIDSYYSGGASKTAQFASDLQKLANRGVNGALLAEIAQDSSGPQLATALLSATTGQIASINSNYTAIQGNAAAAAGTVTDVNYKALIDNAQANADQVTAAINDTSEKLRKLIASAFGLTGYASGTDYATPGWHLVGEQGPELAKFKAGGQVKPNQWLTSAQAQGGSQSHVHVHVSGDDSVLAKAMTVVADQRIAQDAHTSAVMLIGGAA